MKKLTSICNVAIFVIAIFLPACATTFQKVAETPAGSQVIAKTSDKVIQLGLNAAAEQIDTGNPYLHSLADAIRSNPDGLVDPENVAKLVKNFGDPANQHRFRQLGKDLYVTFKDAAVQFGRTNAAELLAEGIQTGA